MIRRRSSMSSSFVLGSAASGSRLRALQLDTSHAPATVGSYEKAPENSKTINPTARNTVGSR